ncbi:hypothetical protein GCM10023310_00670 [Paenibacillus vulneris]|uniref:Uncharacterized protein n=1 Tax=Paenibacillus vulneris TaxID=1133364 RepID=A0ABW3V006_9BACL
MNQLDVLLIDIRLTEKKVREVAKERGIKIRRHPYSGIDAKFPDGKKVHYFGWKHAYNELMNTI